MLLIIALMLLALVAVVVWIIIDLRQEAAWEADLNAMREKRIASYQARRAARLEA